jgi:hypothetical protein
MELFGNYAPRGVNPVEYPLTVFDEARYLIRSKDRQSGYEKDLGERLAPFEVALQKVRMAYDIISYPLLEDSARGISTRELIRDTKAHPGIDTHEFAHREPIRLDLIERKILGRIASDRGLRFDPGKSVYAYTDLAAMADARGEQIMRRYGSDAIANAIEQGILRPREEIEREIGERLANFDKEQKRSTSSGETPDKPEK